MHDFKNFPELTNSQMQFYYFESPHKQITEDFIARVIKVHDGDTITLRVNFRNFDFPLRFLDINAPEMNKGGKASREWLKGIIEGKDVEILINKKNRVEKWGRLLGDVIFNGMNMGEDSIRTGHAVKFGELSFEQEMEKWH